MEHWPGHERKDKPKPTDKSQEKRKQKDRCQDPGFWQWPHLEHGSIGRTTLVSKGGKVQWSSVVNTSPNARWLPLGKPIKVFPETRSPRVNAHEHSARQRAEKGLQYLRAYFPDAGFPGELLGGMLEAESKEMRRLKAFDPFLGNLLEIMPSHHTRNEFAVVFPMGELGRELNISRLISGNLGDLVFKPAGSPSITFETPIQQISTAIKPSEWIATPSSTLLVRTHTSSSLLRLEHSKVTREVDVTRSEVGGVPIMDSRILASGPDIVVVNRNGKVHKCTTYSGSKATQLIGAHDIGDDDQFWQLGVTGRSDECFLASCKAVKHIDLRSANSVSDVFSLRQPSAIVTAFESPMHGYTSRVTTTSDVIWLDDRFRKHPLLSFKHYRSFDRTLSMLTADLSGASCSLLTSRTNGLITLYDISRGSDGLLHCNSLPSCLPRNGPMFTEYDGNALVTLPSNAELTLLRLCQRGSIRRQDFFAARDNEDLSGSVQEGRVTHQWGGDMQALEKRVGELRTDLGPAGERHYIEVNLRGAYEEIFKFAEDTQEDIEAPRDMRAQLPDIWQDIGETAEDMLTTFDIMSDIGGGSKHPSHRDFFSGGNIGSNLADGHFAIQKLTNLAQWHYSIQDTSIPGLIYPSIDGSALHEHLKELDLAPGGERYESSVRRETEARQQLVFDLVLSNDVYSARPEPFAELHSTVCEATSKETRYDEEPPEVKFGYLHPVRKSGAHYYPDKGQSGEQDSSVSSPLGVRLLLAEWELRTDPKDYTYRDPYGLADIDAQSIPRHKRIPAVPPVTQRKQMPLQRPPLVVAVAAQPPVAPAAKHVPATVQSQTVERTYSQQSGLGFDGFSQEPMTSTQVVPGPFGGRPGARKKPAKKRMGGF